MPQFYPDGLNSVNLSRLQNSDPITIPPEGDFDTPAMQGSMQQILSENLGRYVIVDFLMGTNTFQRRAGILYAVGRSFLVVFNDTYQSFNVIDIFSVKTVSFFGNERPAWLDESAIMGGAGLIGGSVFSAEGGSGLQMVPAPQTVQGPRAMQAPQEAQAMRNNGRYRSLCNR